MATNQATAKKPPAKATRKRSHRKQPASIPAAASSSTSPAGMAATAAPFNGGYTVPTGALLRESDRRTLSLAHEQTLEAQRFCDIYIARANETALREAEIIERIARERSYSLPSSEWRWARSPDGSRLIAVRLDQWAAVASSGSGMAMAATHNT